MSLTITSAKKKIKIRGTDIELASVFAWLDVRSFQKGRILSTVLFYENQAAFEKGNKNIDVDIDGSTVHTEIPKGSEPKLSLAEEDRKAIYTEAGYTVVINP